MKYPVNKEFFPFSHFTPPFRTAKTAGRIGALMRPPRWIRRDSEVAVNRQKITSYDGEEIELLVFDPKTQNQNSACLVYFHGGGFFLGAAGYHYKLAKAYALRTPCKVVFVQYRLTPKHVHPTPSEDCFAALSWTFEHAEQLKIDPEKIAVGGDSAGGALAAAVCQMARDRKARIPRFQLLVYPVTDRRMNTRSQMLYTDTPMWNSKLSAVMWKGYIQEYTNNFPTEVNAQNRKPENVAQTRPSAETKTAYASPMEAKSFENLPKAYVEVAEFDCLRDEGVAYAEAMRSAGVEVELNKTEGTMHGFDIVQKAPTTQAAIIKRINFMQKAFFD